MVILVILLQIFKISQGSDIINIRLSSCNTCNNSIHIIFFIFIIFFFFLIIVLNFFNNFFFVCLLIVIIFYYKFLYAKNIKILDLQFF